MTIPDLSMTEEAYDGVLRELKTPDDVSSIQTIQEHIGTLTFSHPTPWIVVATTENPGKYGVDDVIGMPIFHGLTARQASAASAVANGIHAETACIAQT